MFDLNFLNKKETFESVSNIREAVIVSGKMNPDFQASGDGPKYKDHLNTEDSGSINAVDANVLHNLVNQVRPEHIFEIGTWFGVSAAIMSDGACGADVLTCDKHDFVSEIITNEYPIEPFKGMSEQALKYAKGAGHKFDFAFIDGQLSRSDAKRLVRLMDRKIIAFHDFVGNEKGVKGYRTISEFFHGTLLRPAKGSSIAVYFENGTLN